MLSPKNVKYKKLHRGRLKGCTLKNSTLLFGEFGLRALESVWITANQLEAARRTISRYTKRIGKLLLRIFPDKSITARSPDSRMGSGKGAVKYWVSVVYKGTVICEIQYLPMKLALRTLTLASYKLPGPTQIITQNSLVISKKQCKYGF